MISSHSTGSNGFFSKCNLKKNIYAQINIIGKRILAGKGKSLKKVAVIGRGLSVCHLIQCYGVS